VNKSIKKKLHIDIDEEIKAKLDIIAKNHGIKTNELIRFVLSEYVLKKGK
jgi:antitoxin component of RelBE/YafQ-DinJ toxin-antitoxin module